MVRPGDGFRRDGLADQPVGTVRRAAAGAAGPRPATHEADQRWIVRARVTSWPVFR